MFWVATPPKNPVCIQQMNISQNTKERIEHFVTICTQSFRVLMASMLMMFVHQACGDDEPICDRWHIFENGHLFSVVVNFVSLLNFVVLYISETYRQNFLIDHLDVDNTVPVDNLKNALHINPSIREKINKLNYRHMVVVICNVVIYIINVFVSSYVIIRYYYGGVKTLTGIATNILLVSSKLGEDLYIMYTCRTTEMIGLSTSLMAPISYNVIEKSVQFTNKYKEPHV